MKRRSCSTCMYANVCPYRGVCKYYLPLDFDESEPTADRCEAEEHEDLKPGWEDSFAYAYIY